MISEIARFISNHPLTRQARIAACWRVVSWQVRSRLAKQVTVPWIGDTQLLVQRGMTGATGNIYAGLHEFPDMGFLLHLLRPGDLFIDAGANVGSYTILASGVCGAQTIAFEPDPETVLHLLANVKVNNLAALVRVYELALGATDGQINFTVGLDTVNHVAEEGDENIRTVQQVRLDGTLVEEQPLLMKMDLEGHEEQALRGGLKLLSNPSLRAIEIETLSPAVETWLSDTGFKRMYYNPFTRDLRAQAHDIAASNALFIRDVDFVQERLASAKTFEVLGRSI